MRNHGTASHLTVDGAYVEFQSAVLHALPRDIAPDIAEGWCNNSQGLAKVLREALLPPEKGQPAPAPQPEPLLIPVGTATVAATDAPFVARDHFVVNTKEDAPARIYHMGGNFQKWFLGKIEHPFNGSTVKYRKLSRRSIDGPILKEFGGEEKAETTLTELFALMSAQSNGESGPLLTNGYVNIFYIKDTTGSLRAVYAGWFADNGGWSVYAHSVTRPDEWLGARRVFSRDSR